MDANKPGTLKTAHHAYRLLSAKSSVPTLPAMYMSHTKSDVAGPESIMKQKLLHAAPKKRLPNVSFASIIVGSWLAQIMRTGSPDFAAVASTWACDERRMPFTADFMLLPESDSTACAPAAPLRHPSSPVAPLAAAGATAADIRSQYCVTNLP